MFAIHDWALGISPVTSYSGVKYYGDVQARASGADAVLLIAAVLPNVDLAYFTKSAKKLGMACLIEVHTIEELARVLQVPGVEDHILGINNRDLGTFEVLRNCCGLLPWLIAFFVVHDCALGLSPVTSVSGVKLCCCLLPWLIVLLGSELFRTFRLHSLDACYLGCFVCVLGSVLWDCTSCLCSFR